MKRTRSLICLILTVCLVLSLSVTASAAAPQYKVTISSGLHGTIGSNTTVELTVKSGDSVNYLDYMPTNVDEYYYFKGFHISGQEGAAPPSTIERDLMIVASYGIEGDMAKITVHYQTANGAQLANDDELRGKIGDKPVVPARHIDNYTPNAYNYTFTLTGDREVTFVYTPVPVQQNNQQNNNQNNNQQNNNQNNNQQNNNQANQANQANPANQGNQANQANPANQGNQANAVNPANQANPANPTNQGNNSQGTEVPGGSTEPENNNPPELVDLDNQDVPLARPEAGTVGNESQQLHKNTWTAITIGMIGLLGVIAALIYAVSRKKKKEE